MNSSFNSEGASESESKIFTSFGVYKLAEIELVNFDDKKYFATFIGEFINSLKRYQNGGYEKSVAYEIFEKFGMVVLERGLFGGYVQIRSTVKQSDLLRLREKEIRRTLLPTTGRLRIGDTSLL